MRSMKARRWLGIGVVIVWLVCVALKGAPRPNLGWVGALYCTLLVTAFAAVLAFGRNDRPAIVGASWGVLYGAGLALMACTVLGTWQQALASGGYDRGFAVAALGWAIVGAVAWGIVSQRLGWRFRDFFTGKREPSGSGQSRATG
jgi:hypothetical protein